MTIKTVTIAGGGVLGSQIAYQTAFKGLTVTLYDINDQALSAAKQHVAALAPSYAHDLHVSAAAFAAGQANLTFTTDLSLTRTSSSKPFRKNSPSSSVSTNNWPAWPPTKRSLPVTLQLYCPAS